MDRDQEHRQRTQHKGNLGALERKRWQCRVWPLFSDTQGTLSNSSDGLTAAYGVDFVALAQVALTAPVTCSLSVSGEKFPETQFPS